MIPILFFIAFVFFFFMSLAPGDFFTAYLSDPKIDPEIIEQYRKDFGLNEPFYIQYVKWLKMVIIDHDFGISFSYRQPIFKLISMRIGNTIFLNLWSMFFSFIISYPVSFYFAYKPKPRLEKVVNFTTLLFYSVPAFFLGLIALIFAAKTGLFPIIGATSENYDSLGFWGQIGDRIHHIILPIMVGIIGGIAGSIRSMKVLLSEELNKPYITAVRAKGLTKWSIIKHAFRNSLVPFITGIAGILPSVIGGSLFVEIVFSYPGIGLLMYEATLRKDFYLVLANMVFSSFLVLIGIIVSDILLAAADPRVQIK